MKNIKFAALLLPGLLMACVASGAKPEGQALAAAPELVAKGRSLSFQLCSQCHQVAPGQRQPMRVYNAEEHSDQATLSFMEIADRNGRDAQFVSGILDQPHYPMRRAILSDPEKEAIIAYIQSLAPSR